MATEVTLPQLGESVTEGTITAWLVNVGDSVQADQPLFELSSDKIDTEVPAPASGVLTEIRVQVDETVDVGTVVAVIGEASEAPEPSSGGEAPTSDGAAGSADGGTDTAQQQESDGGDAAAAAPVEEREAIARDSETPAAPASEGGGPAQADGGAAGPADDGPADTGGNGSTAVGGLMSPLVRRLVTEQGIDVSSISPTGQGGRITREDVEQAVERRGGAQQQQPAAGAPAQPGASGQASPQAARPQATPQRGVSSASGDRERVEDLSRIRQRIAAKMMDSLQSSAQLTTVQEADVTGIMRLRERVKDDFKAREGVSLSPFVFMARAAVVAVRRHPTVNAQADWDAGTVRFHDYVNLGVAVDTEKGLLVPNVKGADDLTVAGLARAIKEAADKARGVGKLEMQDIEGGTFTVTNTGSRGVLIDTPILNYPEVAILATGVVQKRPVVLEGPDGDSIAVREMVYLCLTYDHRLIDGADAARFVTDVKQILETHDWAGELGYAATSTPQAGAS